MRGCGGAFRSLCLVLICVAVTGSARGEFTTIAGWDRQLFPSYIVATSTVRGQDEQARSADNPSLLGNGSGILGVRLRSPNDLVLIPGHCYVAFQADKHGKNIAALETTLIGASVEGDAKEVDELSDVVDDDEVEEASWVTFTAAFNVGHVNLEKHAEKLKDAKSGYIIISVADARRRGILPIAFRSDAKFTPVPAAEDSSDDDPESDDCDGWRPARCSWSAHPTAAGATSQRPISSGCAAA